MIKQKYKKGQKVWAWFEGEPQPFEIKSFYHSLYWATDDNVFYDYELFSSKQKLVESEILKIQKTIDYYQGRIDNLKKHLLGKKRS